MGLIEGEVVVVPVTGGDASLAQTELVHRLRARQQAGGRYLGHGHRRPSVRS